MKSRGKVRKGKTRAAESAALDPAALIAAIKAMTPEDRAAIIEALEE